MLTRLTLHDFRNHPHRDFKFTAPRIVFTGANGRGKTNILEAIAVLTLGKSWRETTPADLIFDPEVKLSSPGSKSPGLKSKTPPPSAKITAKFTSGDTFEVLIAPRTRIFRKNEKPTPLRTHLGTIPALFFVPEDLELFTAPRRTRQRFFDRFWFQISEKYRQNLTRALRAAAQKTAALRAEPPELDSIRSWNEILAETVPLVVAERRKFIEKLNPIFQTEYSKISGTTEPIRLHLELAENFDPTPAGIREFFQKNAPREHAARRNFISPLRDDFIFTLRDRPLPATASRGETRSVCLALLAAKKQILQQKTEKPPILCLDDVFSELDDNRQRHLENICENSQIFFTTTHPEHFQNFTGEVQQIEI